jgi:hypothetical protein
MTEKKIFRVKNLFDWRTGFLFEKLKIWHFSPFGSEIKIMSNQLSFSK